MIVSVAVLAVTAVALFSLTASSSPTGEGAAIAADGTDPPTTAPDPIQEPAAIAAALSERAFPNHWEVPNVLLTKDSPSTDALAAGGLQGLFSAPLLLTDSDHLSPATAAEIGRLGQPDVHILGGSEAVSFTIEQQLADAGHSVHRHAGPTGMDTAIDIAERHFGSAVTAVLTSVGRPGVEPEEAMADALPAGSLAAAQQLPVLLTAPDSLSQVTADYLLRAPIEEVLVVGGAETIADQVLSDIEALGLSPMRIGGPDRYGTAVAVAESPRFAEADEASLVVLADGSTEGSWPGSFLGAVNPGRFGGGPVILAEGDQLPPATRSFLSRIEPGSAYVLCSPGVSDAACAAVQEALSPPAT